MFLYLKEFPNEAENLEGLVGDVGLTRDLDRYDLTRKKIKSRKASHHTSSKQRALDLLTAARTII